MSYIETPALVRSLSWTEVDLKNAIQRHHLPFAGTRGRMRQWSERDFVLIHAFDVLHGYIRVARFALRTAERLADLAADYVLVDRTGHFVELTGDKGIADGLRLFTAEADAAQAALAAFVVEHGGEYRNGAPLPMLVTDALTLNLAAFRTAFRRLAAQRVQVVEDQRAAAVVAA